jgi:hypothetical protein
VPALALAAAGFLRLAQAPASDPAAEDPQPVAQPPTADPQPAVDDPAPAREPQPLAQQPAAPAPTAQPPAAASQQPAPAEARPRWWGPFPRPKVSGYGGPALRLSGLHGAFAAFVGLEGGINVVQRVTVGATLMWLLNPVEAGAFAKGPATRINLNYGGLAVDVAYVKGKRVAGTIGGVLGGGGACIQNPENGHCADKTAFFIGEPRAGLRVVLAPIVRLHLAFGWRLVAARTWTGPAALGGPAGTVALEFGWF